MKPLLGGVAFDCFIGKAEKKMAFPKHNDLWKVVAREGLRSFLHVMDEADEATLLEPSNFAPMLRSGLSQIGMSAADLAREEDISKAAVSRWINGQAVPPTPTRKTILNWVRDKAKIQLAELG